MSPDQQSRQPASNCSIPDDFVNAEEAAAILRLSKWTIYQWIGRGYIPHYRLGRLIRLRRSDLAAKIEQERRCGAVSSDFTPGA